MKTLSKLGVGLCFAAGLTFGNTWNGKLMDASCYDSQKAFKPNAKIATVCAPTASTTNFAFRTATGRVYKIDSSASSTMEADIQNGVLKPDKAGNIRASVTGTLHDGIVNVDSVHHIKRIR